VFDVEAQQSWFHQSACREVETDVFFPTSTGPMSSRRAKAICATCGVRVECLVFALRHREVEGIWGGLTERERRSVMRRAGGASVVRQEDRHVVIERIRMIARD